MVGTAGIFVLGMIFSFTFNWAITKYLLQVEVGYFQYYVSIVTFAMVIVPLGYQSLAQREVLNLGRKGLIKLSNQATIAITGASMAFCLIWFYGVTKLNWVKGLTDFSGLYVAMLIIPTYSLNTFFKAVLQGQNKIYSSVLPDVLIRPIILLSSLFFIPALGFEISPQSLLWTLLSIMTASLLFAVVKSFQNNSNNNVIQKNAWFKQALILLPIGLLTTVNERIDVVMVSKLLGPEANAVYGVAFKFALFSGFGLVILNQVMVPHYAAYFKSESNIDELRNKIKPNVRLSFFLSFCVVLCLVFGGEFLLSLFGKSTDNYTEGYWSIIILACGQLFNVAVGSTGYILTMAKKESLVLLSIVCGITVNIILNIILLPILKVEGAAIATSASMIVWNVMMLIFAKRKTGINPTIF